MSKIFVSYARDDARKVKYVLGELKTHGLEFWQDVNNIGNGRYWPEEIAKAIMNCSRFLLFMSSSSMKSDNVRDEVQIAYENKKKRIILRLDNSKLPARLTTQLIGIQRTDYSSSSWETEIVSALGGGKKELTKHEAGPIRRPAQAVKSPPKRPQRAKSVLQELDQAFSENRTYYRDECDAAMIRLDELRSVAGSHWINPALVYREFVTREYLVDKIDIIQDLIRDFQETGSATSRELIRKELKTLVLELSRKTNK